MSKTYKLYGVHNKKTDEVKFIYPDIKLVKMCFADFKTGENEEFVELEIKIKGMVE